MNKTLFISDLHLQADQPEITAALLSFLQTQAGQADALYILGDLFEYWIGDSDLTDYHQLIINALKQFTNSGVATYFMHGNRDFLIGRKFAKQTGIKLLPELYCLELYGRSVLLLHGDSLCTLDQKHQLFRRQMRHPLYRYSFLGLPLSLRRKIANQARNKSRQHKKDLSSTIMDVTPQAVIDIMEHYQVNLLIHGHTHRPAVHSLEINHQPAERIVLGDWHPQGKFLTYFADGRLLL